MKKLLFYLGIIGVGVLFIFPPMAYPQEGKEDILKKQGQTEIMPDSPPYVIGPEDILYINVWKEEALSRTVPVRMDGKISLPLIDEVQAAGLTPMQLKEVLTQKLKKFIDDPHVFVIVTEANSAKVYISGQVRNPGVYKLRAETSLPQIISMAGGFTDWADQKKILIIRKENGKERRITINYKKVIKGDYPASSSIIRAGDTIVVP
jgi:polysaccharide export outer membrane protein